MLDIQDFANVPVVFDSYFENSVLEDRADHVRYLLDQCNVDGYNLEFGVFKGFTINTAAVYNPSRTFYGFDSFEGLPEDWNQGPSIIKKEKFVLSELPKVEENVSLIKGWFNNTLDPWLIHHKGDIRYLNIDSDLYSSCSYVLETLNDRIVPGTVIHFDELCDWRLLQEPKKVRAKVPMKIYNRWPEHEWKALNEWVVKYDRQVKPVSRTYSQASGVVVL